MFKTNEVEMRAILFNMKIHEQFINSLFVLSFVYMYFECQNLIKIEKPKFSISLTGLWFWQHFIHLIKFLIGFSLKKEMYL